MGRLSRVWRGLQEKGRDIESHKSCINGKLPATTSVGPQLPSSFTKLFPRRCWWVVIVNDHLSIYESIRLQLQFPRAERGVTQDPDSCSTP